MGELLTPSKRNFLRVCAQMHNLDKQKTYANSQSVISNNQTDMRKFLITFPVRSEMSLAYNARADLKRGMCVRYLCVAKAIITQPHWILCDRKKDVNPAEIF